MKANDLPSTKLSSSKHQKCRKFVMGTKCAAVTTPLLPKETTSKEKVARPNSEGRFGKFGGKYVPETLIAALSELEDEFQKAIKDPSFQVHGNLCSD